MTSFQFELLLSAVTAVSGWLIGSKNVWGQRLALLSNVLWWIYILLFKHFGLIPMEIIFSIVVIRAWLKWEKEAR